ncbi:MAG: NAD-dependent dihydropyrimidine dehydrogenase subunit PreA, partial [Oscillospiraceae bacterium]|nr:NAD-dependent dihydropyrimidine dehydrogenase subunit PreA [Oscillospiraceae bacterium]
MFEQKLYRTDMIRCTLCAAAPCSTACGKIDCAALLRSIWFADEKAAASRFPAVNPCIGCPAPCEKACVRPGEVPIASLMTRLHDEVQPELEVPVPEDEHRLRTEMCGVPLENPFLLSSSVVASNFDMCSRAFEAGWGGVAFKTICSFEIHEASPRYSAISGSSGTIIGFKNIEQLSDHSV